MPVLPSNKRTTTIALILIFVIHLFNVPHLLSLQSDMLSVLLPLVLASTILATPLAKQNMRQYTIYNKCPTPIDLYIAGAKGGAKDSTIPTKGSVVKSLATGPTTFFTDANGGRLTAEGTIRARFYNDDYYYILADPDHANTRAGLQVKPKNRTPTNGFCETIECDGRGCPQAFSQPPKDFPAPASTPPSPPYYRCPVANTDYDITFCPKGTFPDQGQPIHFNFLRDKCLDVQGAVFADGTPVQIYDCNGSQGQRWIISRGSTKVQLAGTNFCLDAGAKPKNGEQLNIRQCHNKLPAQQWNYTPDNRIALENQGFCADLEGGITTNGHKVQTWKCSNTKNQVWIL